MPIALLQICEWHGARRVDHAVRNPSLAAVREAVMALDGAVRNDLYLRVRAAPLPYLSIGGGAGRYVVSGAENDASFPTLVDPQRAVGHEEAVIVGGQRGLYPRNRVHPLESALCAAEYFWETGRFGGPGLTWEQS